MMVKLELNIREITTYPIIEKKSLTAEAMEKALRAAELRFSNY